MSLLLKRICLSITFPVQFNCSGIYFDMLTLSLRFNQLSRNSNACTC